MEILEYNHNEANIETNKNVNNSNQKLVHDLNTVDKELKDPLLQNLEIIAENNNEVQQVIIPVQAVTNDIIAIDYSFCGFLRFAILFYKESMPLVQNRIGPSILIICIYHFLGWFDDPLQTAAYAVSQSMFFITYTTMISSNREQITLLCGKLNGNQDYKNMRLHFICAVVINYTVLILAFCICIRADLIQIAFGMREDISNLAHKNVFLMLSCGQFSGFNEALKAYIIALKYTKVFLYLNVVLIILYPIITYLFIWVFEQKLYGAALSFIFREFFSLIFLIYYFKKYCKNHEKKFEERFKEVMKILPGHLLSFLKIWPNTFLPFFCFDINTYLIGHLKDTSFQTAFGSSFGQINFAFGFGAGLASRATSMVSNFIGEGKIQLAKMYALYCWICVYIIAAIFGTLQQVFYKQIPYFFSEDPKTIYDMSQLFFYLGIVVLFEFGFAFNTSLVRLCGYLNTLSFLVLFNGIFFMDVANALYLFVFKLGGKSVMYGFQTEVIVNSLCFVSIIYFSDWYKIKKSEQ